MITNVCGFSCTAEKFQAHKVTKDVDSPEVKQFEAYKDAGKEKRRTYGTGNNEGDAPVKDL